MPGRQRIYVVSATAGEADLERIRRHLGRDPLVLTAPTAEAAGVVRTLAVEPEPRVDLLLAPTTFPPADRGHQLDSLVRSHALSDRFRDVVVVTDTASSILLLRALAPDQLATGGAVTIVGLPRGDRPIDSARATIAGLVLGGVSAVVEPATPFLALPLLAALVGFVLTLTEPRRHVGRELLLAAAIAVGVVFLVITGSSRFPASW